MAKRKSREGLSRNYSDRGHGPNDRDPTGDTTDISGTWGGKPMALPAISYPHLLSTSSPDAQNVSGGEGGEKSGRGFFPVLSPFSHHPANRPATDLLREHEALESHCAAKLMWDERHSRSRKREASECCEWQPSVSGGWVGVR